MYILFQFTTYICIQDISCYPHTLPQNRKLTTYICIQDISCLFGRRKGCGSSHNLHMHTRYIYGPNIPIKDANAHNLHMHTRYIGRTVIGLEELLHSQPTYAYKIYHCISTAKGSANHSQPTYAYKIYLK